MSSECPVAAQWVHFDRPVKPADISADIPHFQLTNTLKNKAFELEARVGIGQFTPLLQAKYTRFHWLLNIIRHNPAIPFLTPLVSVLVSVVVFNISTIENGGTAWKILQLPENELE